MASSTTYLALLRGINVGGQNPIRMAALRECFERAGFADVSTYIQSGNVLFRSGAKDRRRLTRKIERMLSDEFGYAARAVIVSHAELRAVIRGAPKGFGEQPGRFLSDVLFLAPPLSSREAMKQVETREGIDEAHAGRGVIYFSRLKARASGSRLSRLAAAPVYQELTIRSWSTTTKLLGKLDELG